MPSMGVELTRLLLPSLIISFFSCIGTVSFSQNSYTVEVGSVMNLPCRVTSAVEWQTVVLYKWMNMSATEIAVVDKDTGVTLTDPSSSYMVTADTVSSDNVTVYLGMAAGSCAEEGVYGCWLVAGDKENPVDTVQANTSVVVIGKDFLLYLFNTNKNKKKHICCLYITF